MHRLLLALKITEAPSLRPLAMDMVASGSVSPWAQLPMDPARMVEAREARAMGILMG
jgi:hypothetical protein